MRITVLGAALTLVMAAGTLSAEPQYGLCQPQIVADVESRFQQKTTSIDLDYITSRSGSAGDFKSVALVFTDGCPGYHVYDIHANEYDCEFRAHFGTPPNYIRYRVSIGGC